MIEAGGFAALRIGDVARLTGTTPRTIRFYEEVGLLHQPAGRRQGGHRLYDPGDVARLRRILELKQLLGVSLDELRELLEAEDARDNLRGEFHASDDAGRRRDIVVEALSHIERQLELVSRRRRDLSRLEQELSERRASLRSRLESGEVARRRGSGL